MNFKLLFSMIRVNQWYKNLVIYLALIFSLMFFEIRPLVLTTLGFLSLCLISSVSYIFNDILDKEKDKHHPEKKNRVIASEKISVKNAGIIALFLLLISIGIAIKLSHTFFFMIVTLFILSTLYSLYFKKILFLDILTIATNFVIRAVAGIFIINSGISLWLVLCPFFLALFLAVGKRKADVDILKEDADDHNILLKQYTKEIINALLIISTTLLIISYSLYAFFNQDHYLLATLPFAIFVIFRYFYLIYNSSEIARKPHKAYKDKELVYGIICWIIATFIILYINTF